MKLLKQIGYKLIVTLCIVMTFCCFMASTPVEASRVNNVKTGEESQFYYSGTTKGTYTVNKSLLDKIIEALGEILDLLFGLATMGIRIVFVGWTVLLERCLTWILEGATGENVDIDSMSSTAMSPSDEYITIESIFFNRVPLLDINIFNFEERDDVSPLGEELNTTTNTTSQIVVQGQQNKMTSRQTLVQGEKKNFFDEAPATGGATNDSLIVIIKKAIASWYYTFRLISIMVMLVLLVFIGVKIAISSAGEKAIYKRVLVDWLVGMILVFSIHYIMLFIIQFNEMLVGQISNVSNASNELKVYEYGLIDRAQQPPTNTEMETSMYDEVRTRAYDARMSVGFTGMIMYMVLVFYAWKYTFIYLKRYLTIAVLVIVAPIVAVTYAFNKVQTGKSKIFTGWLKEFFFTVFLQSIHAIIYVVFVSTALKLSLTSIAGMIISFITLHFVGKAEKIFRTIFNIQGNLTNDITEGGGLGDLAKSFKAAATTMGAFTLGKNFSKAALRATTKPIRMAGNAAFAGVMKARANGTPFSKLKDVDARREKYETDSQLDEAERLEKRRKGAIGAELLGNSIKNRMRHPLSKSKRANNSLISNLEEELEEWKSLKGHTFTNEDGEEVEINDEFISEKENELSEIKAINKHKLKWVAKSTFAGRGRWRNILNPYQYVEKGEDGRYHAVKTERPKAIFPFHKKTDSVGKRFLAHFKTDEELKKALNSQLDMIKDQIFGFTGILIGLPTLIAEPKIGVFLLYQGVSRTSRAYGKSEDFKNVKVLPKGQRFTLKGFAGSSKQTIANTALQMAREQILQNDEIIIEQHEKTVATVKGKQSGGNIKLGNKSRGQTTFKSSGFKISRLNNIQAAYVQTLRVVNKLDKKSNDAQRKSSNDFLEMLADKYYEMEADKNKEAFSDLYLAITDKQEKEIDNMSIQEVQRELGYKEQIEVIKQSDGKITLSGSSENTIIDNAIIESAQKCGIMDIRDFDLSSKNMSQITNTIIKELRANKILGKDEDISSVIEDLENKIKDRQAKLAAEGARPVEEKMADQAIIDVMREQGITDPTQVSTESVIDKYQEIYSVAAGETTKQSTSVAEQMRARKGTDSDSESVPAREVGDSVKAQEIISDRKEKLSSIANSTTESEELRTELKRKKESELDTTILETQEILDTSATLEITADDSRKTDDVLKLLNYQTEMHKANELVEVGKKSSEKKLKAFKAELFDESASIRRSTSQDGSRQVVVKDDRRITADGSISADRSKQDGSRRVEEILIDLKNGRK